jgi:hypothetical protein
MISYEVYISLRIALKNGANLPICDLSKMAEYERYYALNEQDGEIITNPPIEKLKCMQFQRLQ